MEKYSPIVLFVYNRPEHTLKTLESLMANELAPQSELFVFADGAKPKASPESISSIEKTRTIIRQQKWCGKVTIIENETNKGLAQSVIEGVSKIINEYGNVIVLEDDLVSSPFFLTFMNDALTSYEMSTNVACISAYIYPVKGNLPETFFLRGADCWGWATWKHAWDLFEPNGNKLLKALEGSSLASKFDFEGSYPFTKMLKEHIDGKNDSWAIRWYASAFLKDHYCLYPGKSLVQNIGIDGSGTHSGVSNNWEVRLAVKKINVKPIEVKENEKDKQIVIDYFRGLNKSNRSIFRKFAEHLKSISRGGIK